MDKIKSVFKESLHTGFIDKNTLSEVAYQPELLINQKTPSKKILTTILKELSNCNEFYISVAFVTTSGIATIINELTVLEERGVKGYVLVSQYLNFTQPEALKRLMQFKNIQLRILTEGNAHAKGYIFKNNSHYNLIVGSSNLTASALSTNKEWNIKLSALGESGLVENVLDEFKNDFKQATIVTPTFLETYSDLYNNQSILNKKFAQENALEINEIVSPNEMQKEALANLTELRAKAKNKALIISATGTGKTFLSAFDAKVFNPKKLLFVVHRQTIAIDAMKTFKKVFGNTKSMGVYSGSTREANCDFVFSTVQTISKENHLNQFDPNHFDYIIIDETHRSAAISYQRLLNYFTPKFLLGMTATPERTDGNNIFEQFDHNVAYEIRLSRAMEEDMLSSFHYYGITDIAVNNQIIDKDSAFNLLVSEERINHIYNQANFYGTDNGIVRGLIFCSRKEEANKLSEALNTKGLKTLALTGDHSEEERKSAIELLSSDNLADKLDYIITVDIFNEGIDIPKINQIIMLRPTVSAIIFIQQLGRGLRKAEGKGYLTVIDFIGNYENNYLIPIALYGDTSYNKDTIRKLITEGSRLIPGASTINFDKITKERIFQSIDKARMTLLADLKKDYNLLKFRLGRIPMMMDFIHHNARDPYLFIEYSKSYFNFVNKVEQNNLGNLSTDQIKLLELFAKEINNGKRVEESIILKCLIENGYLTLTDFKNNINQTYGYEVTDETLQSCLLNLNFEFIREKKNNKLISIKEIYKLEIINCIDNTFSFSESFSNHLNNPTFKKFLLDSARYSIEVFDKSFKLDEWYNGFVLYKKYARKDVFRILNSKENPVAQNVGGYLVSADNSNCPIFVNYHKEDHISESTKYVDEFVNHKEFDWMSKSNRNIESNDVQSILGKKGDIRLPLFIKKSNDEGTEFYYMGEMKPNLNMVEQSKLNNDNGGNVSVVKIRFDVTPAVVDTMYSYINDNSGEKLDSKSKLADIPKVNTASESNIQIPLYNFYAAAGSFSSMQADCDYTLIDAPTSVKNSSDYFACKIIGESMNKVIPNGSIALFKFYSGGSRNGKIVLVENRDLQDNEFNSAFTVKTYHSEKSVTDELWNHTMIKLLPNSHDKSYQPIILTEENAQQMKIIGEFITIID